MTDKQGGLTKSYRAGILLNVVLICALGTALAIGIVAIVRQVSYRTRLRFDWNQDARYEISDAERELLADIKAPVECIYAWGFDSDVQNRVIDTSGRPRADLLAFHYAPILNEAARRVQSILEEWAKFSPEIKVRVVADDRAPAEVDSIAKSMGMNPEDILNKVIFRQGPRKRELPLRRMMEGMDWGYFPPIPGAPSKEPSGPAGWHVHDELFRTLRALVSGEPLKLGIVRGHDSELEFGGGRFASFSQMLELEGYALYPVDLERVERVPSEIGALLLIGLQKRLSSRELQLLQDSEARGGRFLIVTDPRLSEDYSSLLEPYGTAFLSGLVEDKAYVHPARQGPTDLHSSRFCSGKHPIDSPLKGLADLYLGFTRPISIGTEKKPGAVRTGLLLGSSDSQIIPIEFHPQTGQWTKLEGRTRALSATERVLAAALSRPIDSGNGEARLVLVGGSGLVAPNELALATRFGNKDFLLNSLAWLTNRSTTAALGPRDEHQSRTVRIDVVERPFFLIAVLGLPLVAALFGVLVYFTRRS